MKKNTKLKSLENINIYNQLYMFMKFDILGMDQYY